MPLCAQSRARLQPSAGVCAHVGVPSGRRTILALAEKRAFRVGALRWVSSPSAHCAPHGTRAIWKGRAVRCCFGGAIALLGASHAAVVTAKTVLAALRVARFATSVADRCQ